MVTNASKVLPAALARLTIDSRQQDNELFTQQKTLYENNLALISAHAKLWDGVIFGSKSDDTSLTTAFNYDVLHTEMSSPVGVDHLRNLASGKIKAQGTLDQILLKSLKSFSPQTREQILQGTAKPPEVEPEKQSVYALQKAKTILAVSTINTFDSEIKTNNNAIEKAQAALPKSGPKDNTTPPGFKVFET